MSVLVSGHVFWSKDKEVYFEQWDIITLMSKPFQNMVNISL